MSRICNDAFQYLKTLRVHYLLHFNLEIYQSYSASCFFYRLAFRNINCTFLDALKPLNTLAAPYF